MKLIFNIGYHTSWGEAVYVTGNIPALGDGSISGALKLSPVDSDHWSGSVTIPDSTTSIAYHYIVVHENGSIKSEWGHGNCLTLQKDTPEICIYDKWQDQPLDKPFYSSAFTECINCHASDKSSRILPEAGMTMFVVEAPMIGASDSLVLCGADDTLGNWNPANGIRMNCAEFPLWKVNIPSSVLSQNTEFKFVIVDTRSGDEKSWEGGENRRLGICPDVNMATVVSGLRFINAQKPWRGAGTAIPVFSIRTTEDFGVGDFYDLIPMIDWAKATAQSFIQILPINDTTMTHTWTDSYPYNANSTFALHPMYLRLDQVGVLRDRSRMKYYRDLGAELNSLREIDYERVNKGKIEYLREIFAQDGAETAKSQDYKDFTARNGHWLLPYAAFCTMRDRFGTPDYHAWGEYATFSDDIIARISTEAPSEIAFHCFVQYHLDRQMTYVHNYAKAHGVALKGDVPIGISRTSADAWQNPRLFNLDCQAGAPPDDFSVLGQNWGLPTYNWEEMSKDGFVWWKSRFRKMSEYFDAYRIDHVLGFFRIWEIPLDAIHGLLGYFNPALPFSVDEMRYNYDFWIDQDLHTRPYIMDYFLDDFFGPYKEEAVRTYLDSKGGGRYAFKPEYDSQRKIAECFAALPKDEKNTRICNALMGLADEVLFIEDPREKGKYHPRISAQYTYIYRSLSDYERWCFNRLYNDFFYHRHNDFWYGKAMWKLPPLIDATDMLVCAEDLGMIPACVPPVIQNLEILSLEIQRMPKDVGYLFGNTWNYPYFSVCTTSTHDMGGIRQWWEEDREKTQKYFNEVLHQSGEAPFYAEPWICDRIVDLHLQSPSMLCILPLQDWLSVNGDIRRTDPREEQINVPAESRHYWRYRMHLTVDQLIANNGFTAYIHEKIRNPGR